MPLVPIVQSFKSLTYQLLHFLSQQRGLFTNNQQMNYVFTGAFNGCVGVESAGFILSAVLSTVGGLTLLPHLINKHTDIKCCKQELN